MKKTMILLASLSITTSVFAAENTPLSLEIYNANSNSFHVNSTMVYGETEVAVIDTGFSKSDALRIAANVLDSGKKLTTIFVSQADPDYYFGAETLKKLFPEARLITTPTVRKLIKETLAGKIAYWGPKMGNNVPENGLIPNEYKKLSFTVDGHTIEIKGTKGLLAHRPYLWIPSKKAIVGNVAVFGDLHVWTADTQDQPQWDAWLSQLVEMEKLAPQIVVPGHMKKNTKLDINNLHFTSKYLTTFAKEKKNSANGTALINKMTEYYPNAAFPLSLTIGAKVHKGEMKW